MEYPSFGEKRVVGARRNDSVKAGGSGTIRDQSAGCEGRNASGAELETPVA